MTGVGGPEIVRLHVRNRTRVSQFSQRVVAVIFSRIHMNFSHPVFTCFENVSLWKEISLGPFHDVLPRGISVTFHQDITVIPLELNASWRFCSMSADTFWIFTALLPYRKGIRSGLFGFSSVCCIPSSTFLRLVLLPSAWFSLKLYHEPLTEDTGTWLARGRLRTD